MEEKRKYKNRTQITFSLPLQLKQKAQDIIQKYNKQTNDDLNLSRFCVYALNLACNFNTQIFRWEYSGYKEGLDTIFLSNKMQNLYAKYVIAKNAKEYFENYEKIIEEYFKFKNSLDKEKQKEWEKFEERGLIPDEYYVLRQKNEIN